MVVQILQSALSVFPTLLPAIQVTAVVALSVMNTAGIIFTLLSRAPQQASADEQMPHISPLQTFLDEDPYVQLCDRVDNILAFRTNSRYHRVDEEQACFDAVYEAAVNNRWADLKPVLSDLYQLKDPDGNTLLQVAILRDNSALSLNFIERQIFSPDELESLILVANILRLGDVVDRIWDALLASQ